MLYRYGYIYIDISSFLYCVTLIKMARHRHGMRRRRHEAEPKLLSKKNVISIFIVVIMVLSVAGIIVVQRGNTPTNNIEYYGYTFVPLYDGTSTIWETEWKGRTLNFIFEPNTAEQVEIEGDPISRLKDAKMFYFSYDDSSPFIQDMALVQFDYQRLLDQNLGIYVERGMAFENDFGIPLITCSTATPDVPVLLFRSGNESKLFMEGDCVVAEVTSQSDVYLIGDRILYSMFGIME